MEQTETKRLEVYDLKDLDFGCSSLAIGVEIKDAETPWLPLDKVDLMLLHGLLTTVLPGAEKAACEASPSLGLLAEWAKAGADWMRRHGHD